jgi:hypothetical protein
MKRDNRKPPVRMVRVERETAEQYRHRLTSGQRILKAMQRIDLARENLVTAQNDLMTIVAGVDELTRDAFLMFYKSGGVTAADWEVDIETGRYQFADRISRGQLRLVHGGRRAPLPVRKGYRPSQNGDGPDAA